MCSDSGSRVETRCYYLRYRYGDMVKDRWTSTGHSTKDGAQEWARQFRKEWEAESVGIALPRTLRNAARKPLTDHLSDYLEDLRSRGRTGRRDIEIKLTRNRIERILKECNWRFAADISADSFCRWRNRLDGISPATKNHYLDYMRSFLNWMVKQERIGKSPLQSVEKVSDSEDFKRMRRALSDSDLTRLLNASPYYRKIVYLTAARSGLRKAELRELLWKDVVLDGENPHILARASISKNGKSQRIPMVAELVECLNAHRPEGVQPKEKVFRDGIPNIDSLKKDLSAAGIPYQDDHGKFADFHALRYTFATFLFLNGVLPAMIKELMRHSDYRLTEKIYNDKTLMPLGETVRALPSLEGVSHIRSQISGTSGHMLTSSDQSELNSKDSQVFDYESSRSPLINPDQSRQMVEVASVEPVV